MKYIAKLSAVLIFCFYSLAVMAQTEGRDFKSVDAHAKSLGKLDKELPESPFLISSALQVIRK